MARPFQVFPGNFLAVSGLVSVLLPRPAAQRAGPKRINKNSSVARVPPLQRPATLGANIRAKRGRLQ